MFFNLSTRTKKFWKEAVFKFSETCTEILDEKSSFHNVTGYMHATH